MTCLALRGGFGYPRGVFRLGLWVFLVVGGGDTAPCQVVSFHFGREVCHIRDTGSRCFGDFGPDGPSHPVGDGFRVGCVHHWMPPTVWAWVGLGWLGMGFEPRFWLHCRQVTRALSMVSRPPRAAGTTWSGSGLLGWSVVPHARARPQSGQCVCPLACARWRTRTRQRLWRAVPVREVPGLGVMRASVARPPTSWCAVWPTSRGPGAPTSWCARGPAAGWWVSSV
nr:MAG TPA: hypothetical protein [Caudoviricetes sp.]